MLNTEIINCYYNLEVLKKLYYGNELIWEKYEPIVYNAIDLGLPSGILWADRNIGAKNIIDNGLYFQWGDIIGYTNNQIGYGEGQKIFNSIFLDYKWSGPNANAWNNPQLIKYCNDAQYGKDFVFTDTLIKLENSDDAAHIIMGDSWRMPTKEDFQELLDNTTNKWVDNESSINGRLFTSKTNGNSIFIPAAGHAIDGNIIDLTNEGSLWSSSLCELAAFGAWFMMSNNNNVDTINYISRLCGYPIRGVMNS